MAEQTFDYSVFDNFETEFKAANGSFRDNIDMLPDGSYPFAIVDAEPAFTKNGKQIFRLGLRVNGGAVFTHTYFVDSQDGLNRFGSDVAALGFDIELQLRAGKKLREIIPQVLKQIVGVHFLGAKVTDRPTSGNYAGKVFHKIKIISRTAPGGTLPATKTTPAQPSAPTSGAQSSSDLIPF